MLCLLHCSKNQYDRKRYDGLEKNMHTRKQDCVFMCNRRVAPCVSPAFQVAISMSFRNFWVVVEKDRL